MVESLRKYYRFISICVKTCAFKRIFNQKSIVNRKDIRGLNFSFYAHMEERDKVGEKRSVNMDIKIKGNSLKDQVIIYDDEERELKKVSQNSDEGSTFYEGRFIYTSNTDGGVIGPIGVDDKFEIEVKFLNEKNIVITDKNGNVITNVITEARFFSASGENFILKNEENGGIESFKIAYDGYSDCDE